MTPLKPATKGTITYRGQTRTVNPAASNMNPLYQPPGAPGAVAGTSKSPAPNPITPMPRASRTPVQPAAQRPTYRSGVYEPGSFGDMNARVNAGIYEPGTPGAANALVNGTGVVAPRGATFLTPVTGLPAMATPPNRVISPTTIGAQQTESANPLTGDGNQRAGGTTSPVRPAVAMGFSRAGSQIPRGQDAIGASMRSTFDNLRGGPALAANRSFGQQPSGNPYDRYVKQLFAGVTA